MSAELTRLSNGLTVVTETMPHLETTSLGIWVGVGARHERAEQHGLSHFLEHMAFKGTTTRTARQIAEEIEAVGGDLNAATDLEATAYFARVLKGDEALALDIIADILNNATFAEEELERERQVILQEIAGTRDCPDEIALDLLHEAAFPRQAAGRTILGTPESVQSITPGDLKAYLNERYHPGNMVLAAAGALTHDSAVRHAEALFGGLSGSGMRIEAPANYEGGVRASARRFEQSHLVMGFHGPSYREAEYFAAQVLSGVLGGGMSSRLFQEVRERRGLCYSIYSSAWGLKDTGMFAVHAATGEKLIEELIDVVSNEIDHVADREPQFEEVGRAKAQLKAGLLMALESSARRAEQMARQVLLHGRLIPVSELITAVDSVTPSDICMVAGKLRRQAACVAVVGAGRKSRDFAARAGQRLTCRH